MKYGGDPTHPSFHHQPITDMCPSVVKTAFGFESQARHMALHMLSAIVSDRKGSFIFVHIVLAALAVLIQYPAKVSSSFLVNLNKRLMAFISHPLILMMSSVSSST